MKKLILAVAVALSALACTDEGASREALLDEGYTDIQFHGHAFFECGRGDDFATAFTAKNANGRGVEGAVCCGFFKGCTVRH